MSFLGHTPWFRAEGRGERGDKSQRQRGTERESGREIQRQTWFELGFFIKSTRGVSFIES